MDDKRAVLVIFESKKSNAEIKAVYVFDDLE